MVLGHAMRVARSEPRRGQIPEEMTTKTVRITVRSEGDRGLGAVHEQIRKEHEAV